eukprot:XP_001704892.1 Hypothetical protein GL50803_32597 [Giardia lamblia ATCC 50803]
MIFPFGVYVRDPVELKLNPVVLWMTELSTDPASSIDVPGMRLEFYR